MPSRSTGAVYQKEEPLVSDAFSARVSSVSRRSMSSIAAHLTFLIGSTTRAPISAATPAV